MSGVPSPTRDQMNRALDLHGQDPERAADYLCVWLGIAHPAARAHVHRRVHNHREAPHDTLDH